MIFITSCSCRLFVSCWCLIIALHSTKVGDRGALSVGMWTLTVLSLIVTTRTDCPTETPCFAPDGGVLFNENAYGQLRFECCSWECCDFVFDLPELLGFVFKLFAVKGGVGVAFTAVPFLPDPLLKDKVNKIRQSFFKKFLIVLMADIITCIQHFRG